MPDFGISDLPKWNEMKCQISVVTFIWLRSLINWTTTVSGNGTSNEKATKQKQSLCTYGRTFDTFRYRPLLNNNVKWPDSRLWVSTEHSGEFYSLFSKWFEPTSDIISNWSTIVQVSVALRRTVWGDIDWCFSNLSGSHHQSQVTCVTSVDGINTVAMWLVNEVVMLLVDGHWLRRL